jgi:hypothetical protein
VLAASLEDLHFVTSVVLGGRASVNLSTAWGDHVPRLLGSSRTSEDSCSSGSEGCLVKIESAVELGLG